MAEQPPSANPYAPPAAHVEDVEPAGGGTLATRGSRFGAAMVDLLISLAVWGILAALTPFNIFRSEPDDATRWSAPLLGFVLFLAVHGYWLATQGQTIGKVVAKIRIVRTDGSRASFPRLAFARYLPTSLAAAVPFIGPLFALVDVLLIFRDSRKCLHDNIADTLVVRA